MRRRIHLVLTLVLAVGALVTGARAAAPGAPTDPCSGDPAVQTRCGTVVASDRFLPAIDSTFLRDPVHERTYLVGGTATHDSVALGQLDAGGHLVRLSHFLIRDFVYVSSAAMAGERVAVTGGATDDHGNRNPFVALIDPASGHLTWTRTWPACCYTSAIAADRRSTYVAMSSAAQSGGTPAWTVVALDNATGRVRWTEHTSDRYRYGTPEAVTLAAGRVIVTGYMQGGSGNVARMDVIRSDGRQAKTLTWHHGYDADAIAVTPSPDGKLVAAAGWGSDVAGSLVTFAAVVDPRTARARWAVFGGSSPVANEPAHGIVWSGNTVAVAVDNVTDAATTDESADNSREYEYVNQIGATGFDATTGVLSWHLVLADDPRAATGFVYAASLSRDGRTMYLAGMTSPLSFGVSEAEATTTLAYDGPASPTVAAVDLGTHQFRWVGRYNSGQYGDGYGTTTAVAEVGSHVLVACYLQRPAYGTSVLANYRQAALVAFAR